jgi:riboflavin synthase alpha subunit
MFTGIVESTGRILSIRQIESGTVLLVEARKLASRCKKGDSVSIDGICLTVTGKKTVNLSFDISAETRNKTNLSTRSKGDLVNLELPMTANSMISGHFVQGHVDGLARVSKWKRENDDVRLFVELPSELIPYCVTKGSIALNGVSLTIASLEGSMLGVALIPYTLARTNLDDLMPGDLVNVETDIIGRYVVSTLKRTYDELTTRTRKTTT